MRKLALLLAVLLAACSGGGGGGSQATNPSAQPSSGPPPKTAIDPAGIWAGSARSVDSIPRSALCRVETSLPTELNCILFVDGRPESVLATVLGSFDPSSWSGNGTYRPNAQHLSYPFEITSGEALEDSFGNKEITIELDIIGVGTMIIGGSGVSQPPSFQSSGTYAVAKIQDGESSFSIDSNGAYFGQTATCTIDGSSNGLSIGKRLMQGCAFNCGTPNGSYEGFALYTQPMYVPETSQADYEAMLVFALFYKPNAGWSCQGNQVSSDWWMSGYALK